MNRDMVMRVAIVGGGLTGLAMSAILRIFGIEASVFEKGARLRNEGSGIFLWPQGVQVLKFISVRGEPRSIGQEIGYLDTYDRRGTPINSVSVKHDDTLMASAVMFQRSQLIQYLHQFTDENFVFYDHEVSKVTSHEDQPTLHFCKHKPQSYDLVIDAGGVFSPVRSGLSRIDQTIPKPVFAGLGATRGVVHYVNPLLQSDRAQVFTYNYSRIVTYPLDAKTGLRYWFAAYQPDGINGLLNRDGVTRAYSEIHPVLLDMLGATKPENVLQNRLYSMSDGQPWFSGNVAFVGDSAHAMLPTLGYGFTLGLENSFLLASSIAANSSSSVRTALQRYKRRAADRSSGLVKVMDDISRLYYFEPEGSVQATSLAPIIERFRDLSCATVL